MDTKDITAAIRKLRDIEIEECAVIVRALASKLNERQKGYKVTQAGRVYCPVEMALEQLDLCADLVSESAEMEVEA